jgi:hypothetical protein
MRKLSRKKIVKLLKAAEKAFRLPPSLLEMNYGLCYYIRNHPAIVELKEKRKTEYLKEILGGHYSDKDFTFCKGHSQEYVWHFSTKLKKFERADFCAERLKDYK